MKHKIFIVLLASLFFAVFGAHAQTVVRGVVKDAQTNELLFGTNVIVQGTSTGTSTNQNGEFELSVPSLPAKLLFSFIGYSQKVVEVTSGEALEVLLEADTQLEDVVVVGSRFAARSIIDSPVPIDNIKFEDLQSTGQPTFDKMLMYSVPAFNSTQQTISDATAHFDPADLRGLGPSRTLVLINGKRKNPSALVYINDTPGKGEVGVDMKSIPAAAIKRVEVLRDGASAQYGSDAIAGVLNIILKDEVEYTNINFLSGITTQGDGRMIGYNVNTGFKIGEKGFLNLTTSFSETLLLLFRTKTKPTGPALRAEMTCLGWALRIAG